MKYLSPFAGLLLLFAVAPISYVYYPFLLTAVSLIASLVGFDTIAKETIKLNYPIVFGFLFVLISILYNPILLYNPFFNIHFEKEIWNQVNNFTALIFIVHYFQILNYESQMLKNERIEILDKYESKFSTKLGVLLFVNFGITIIYLMIFLPIYYGYFS
jgi:hypothetical protein